MKRVTEERADRHIEVTEAELREFLHLADDETCYTVTGGISGPFKFRLMDTPHYKPGRPR